MTPAQQSLLDQLSGALAADPRVRSLWLGGSFAHGEGDAWSDIDLVAEVDAADVGACVADYLAPRPGMPPTVLARALYGCIVTAVTPEWSRFDLLFLPREHIDRYEGRPLQQLAGGARELPPPEPPKPDAAARQLEGQAQEFLRVLGLMPVGVGRGEWLVMQQGYELLRQMAVELMVEETGAARGVRGVKRLNPYLTAEQRAALEALDPPRAERGALVSACCAVARLYLGRARPMATRLGVAWPQALEDATRRHLRTELGVEI